MWIGTFLWLVAPFWVGGLCNGLSVSMIRLWPDNLLLEEISVLLSENFFTTII